MPRPKKDGRKVTFILSNDIDDRLNTYCKKEFRTRTAAVEYILHEFFVEYEKKKGKLNP